MKTSLAKVPPKALTEQEAAQYIGMSVHFLRRSRVEGARKTRTPAPPVVRIGRSCRYLIEDLDAFLEEQRHRL